jgi:hypothetical protein
MQLFFLFLFLPLLPLLALSKQRLPGCIKLLALSKACSFMQPEGTKKGKPTLLCCYKEMQSFKMTLARVALSQWSHTIWVGPETQVLTLWLKATLLLNANSCLQMALSPLGKGCFLMQLCCYK